MASIPAPAHVTRIMPTDPVRVATVLAEAKIPDPIMVPITSEMPDSKPTCRLTTAPTLLIGRHPVGCAWLSKVVVLPVTMLAVLLVVAGSWKEYLLGILTGWNVLIQRALVQHSLASQNTRQELHQKSTEIQHHPHEHVQTGFDLYGQLRQHTNSRTY